MVFYFKARPEVGDFTIFMGLDKFENEELIKYGFPEDIWFHVDKMSSAHVYVRLHKGQTIDDISEGLLEDCVQLVKENSIQGNKVNNIDVVYTPWSNLKKTASMDVGQVGFYSSKMVRTVRVEKRINEIVNRLNRTKVERKPDLKVTTSMASLNEETAKKVLRQVEFYFSDSNLPRDEFLKKSISESEDGMISLALICSFSRMRGHLGLGDLKADAIPEDSVKAVAETLRKSTTLKISEDGQKVGRATEILKPEEVIEQVDIRTVAAAPLEFDVKLEDVETFFGQFGKVNSVRLPRHVADKKLFCGTALVEFSTEEDANKILTETLTYGGVQLELKPKKEFDTERAKETEEYEKTRPLTNSNRKNNAKPEEDYPKGLIVAFTLKSSSDKDSTEKNGTPEETQKEAGGVNAEDGEKDNKENVDEKNSLDGEEKKTEDGEKPSEGVKEGEKEGKLNAVETYKDNMDVVMREDLKILFGKFGTVKYIDFKIGEVSGFVRFEEPEAAHKARAAAVLTELGGLVVKNFIATLEPVSGEAEKEYWKNFRGSHEKFRESKGGNRGRGGKYHRGGHKHGRSRDDNNGGRPNKHRKF
ncbi:hypothetical protein ACLB2K_017798 [Fragaria x ananassa]